MRDRARAFRAPLHYVFYVLFLGGRDLTLRQHLLNVGPLAGWECIEQLRGECRLHGGGALIDLVRDEDAWRG